MFNEDGPRMVLTEGKNDCHVLTALCKAHNVPHNFKIRDCGSDELALKKLSAEIASSEEREILGIVLDADNPNLEAKWDSIRNRLEKENYTVNSTPNLNGTILESSGKPKIGIWLMPNNRIDGMLEDFCIDLAGEEAISFAKDCVTKAKEKSFSTFIDNHESKSIIHTYLAWQNEPGLPLGLSITARALNPETHIATVFTNFLKDLFN